MCEDLPEVSIDFTSGRSIRAVIFCSLLNNKFYKSSKGYFFIFVNQIWIDNSLKLCMPMFCFNTFTKVYTLRVRGLENFVLIAWYKPMKVTSLSSLTYSNSAYLSYGCRTNENFSKFFSLLRGNVHIMSALGEGSPKSIWKEIRVIFKRFRNTTGLDPQY